MTRLLLLAVLGWPLTAAAQDTYPTRPIRWIVPFVPGGSTTVIARLLGQRLTESWGQQVVVDNRGGGNTIIGSEALVRAAPDGYTILQVTSTHAINPSLLQTPYDAVRDFAPANFALAPSLRAAESPSQSFLVTGHPPSAAAGMKILRDGGNAIDAAIAAGLVAAVTSPHNCGIGGYGGHMVIAPAGGKIVSIDFNTSAPAAAKADMFSIDAKGAVANRANEFGWLASGVPGTLAGLQLALNRYGTRPLREVFAPAIAYARDGFEVTDGFRRTIRSMANQLRKDAGSRKLYFLENGEPLEPGNLFRNPDLAKMLQTLADENSVERFYRGDIARKIAAQFQQHGGLVSEKDMADYRAREVEPLQLKWDNNAIHTAPLTAGGLTVLQALSILQALNWNVVFGGVARSHALVEALRLAWRDRLALLGDPEKSDVPVARLLSTAYADELAAKIKTAVENKRLLAFQTNWQEHSGTIHLSSVDQKGNAVALTLTHGNSYGACVTVDGLGLTLGHGMSRFDPKPNHPNSIAPGKRPLHNMCPTIVTRDSKPILVFGGAGGRMIPNAIFNVLTNFLAADKSLAQAIAAPRFNTQGALDLTFESTWPKADVDHLKSLGYQLKTGASANVNAIAINPTSGSCEGASR